MRHASWTLLLALGAALLCAAAPEPDGYRLDDYHAPVPATVRGGSVIATADLKAALDAGGVLLFDVVPEQRRPPETKPGTPWMPLPRRDLPGSRWLPDVGRGALNPGMDSWFRDELADATGGDKNRAVVFYCRAECWMSWNAARRAIGYGYRHVIWYPEGTDGWQQAGLPLVAATPRHPPE